MLWTVTSTSIDGTLILDVNKTAQVFGSMSLLDRRRVVDAQYKQTFRGYSHQRFIRRELLCELFCPHNREKWVHNSGGSRIPRRRGRQPSGGASTYDFAKFCEKLHEIEKILGHGGAPSLSPPLHNTSLNYPVQAKVD